MEIRFKRYCKTLSLEEDPELIEEYKKWHANGGAWLEIAEGMKKVGILDMEIYIQESTLFMIMDTVEDFDHDSAMLTLKTLPKQAEWESLMSKFQQTFANASAKEKWKLLDRIYKMDQKKEYPAIEGQLEEISQKEEENE